MGRRSGRASWRHAACALLLAVGVPRVPPALGRTMAVVVPSDPNLRKQEYEAAIGAALKAFERGDFARAYGHFTVAHLLVPSARTLRGMGLCAFQLGDFANAATHLRAALATTINPLPPKLVDEASGMLKRAQERIATVDLVLSPANAQVAIDRGPAADNAHVFLAPGPHTLEIRAPERTPKKLDLRLGAGEKRTVDVELQPLVAAVASPEPEPARSLASASPPAPPSQVRLRLLGESEGLVFWVQDLAADHGFRKLCRVPCEVNVKPGGQTLALSDGEGGKPLLAGVVSAQENTVVRGEYREVASMRVFKYMGWGMVALGAAFAGVGLLSSDRNTRIGLALTGGIIAFVGGTFVLVAPDPVVTASLRSQAE